MTGEVCSIVRQPCVIRFARLAVDGSTPAGATNGYIAAGLIEGKITPNYNDTSDILVTDACDNVLVNEPPSPIYRGVDVELSFGHFAPERIELSAGVTLLTSAGSSVGFAMQAEGPITGYGVSVEIFLNKYEGGVQSATTGFLRAVLPRLTRVKMAEMNMDRTNTAWKITGFGLSNPNFGNGPINDITGVTPTTRSFYIYSGDTSRPTAACGYFAIPTQV